MTASDHEIYLDWSPARNSWDWNEVCADIMEVFGLPGNKYVTTSTVDYMIFTFKNKKDADLCRILISDKI